MFSLYLFCVVLGGGFALLAAFGDLFGVGEGSGSDGPAPDDETPDAVVRPAATFSLRSLSYSLLGFGAGGAILTWLGAGPGAPLTLVFAVLSGLLLGGALSSWVALLKRWNRRSRGD